MVPTWWPKEKKKRMHVEIDVVKMENTNYSMVEIDGPDSADGEMPRQKHEASDLGYTPQGSPCRRLYRLNCFVLLGIARSHQERLIIMQDVAMARIVISRGYSTWFMSLVDGFALENILSEKEICHVRSSPWVVNGEESYSGEREPVDVVLVDEPVNRARRNPDNGGLRIGYLGNFEQINEPHYVRSHCLVIEISFDDENMLLAQKILARSFQRRIVIVISKDSGTFLQSDEDERVEMEEKGLSIEAKFDIMFGVGITLSLIVGLVIHFKVDRRHNDQNPNPEAFSVVKCLDGRTIELYPMTLLGESRRLATPSDNTSSSCLSEYRAKETLRTILGCNHYFHDVCIDEWLMLNVACPLYRCSPEKHTSMVALSSSLSS
ncbi:putative RING/U-box superfamily protein [Hibiscus syriacus]|uniref:RING-type E3 ubiquitin transferase n=1 Tax=Hibiscus syriacus TaxID=106335 RepID=A0A6A2XJQ4_HIBSY|nr:putative RING/U-box superfamily protein [Hibiscus syriacus]